MIAWNALSVENGIGGKCYSRQSQPLSRQILRESLAGYYKKGEDIMSNVKSKEVLKSLIDCAALSSEEVLLGAKVIQESEKGLEKTVVLSINSQFFLVSLKEVFEMRTYGDYPAESSL